MAEQTKVTTLEKVVIRFSGDSGDGMQLTGTIFSNLSAIFGNEISTFTDYPAEVRAPQGTLSGVSGFQVHLGSRIIFTPGDKADVLVAMNPAALKVNVKNLKPNANIFLQRSADLLSKPNSARPSFTIVEIGAATTCTPPSPNSWNGSSVVNCALSKSLFWNESVSIKTIALGFRFVGCSNVRWMKRCTCCRTSSPKSRLSHRPISRR